MIDIGEQTEIGREAFITQSNAASIVHQIPVAALGALVGELYKRPIYIFGRKERQRLLAIKAFFQDSEVFIENCYQRMNKGGQDPRLVFADSDPAYHLSLECEYMHFNYSNIEIPAQIRVRGEEACGQFRAWFIDNQALYETRRELFMIRLSGTFNININELVLVEHINSGVAVVMNESLDAIAAQIDRLLSEAGRFYYASAQNNAILRQYQHFSGLGHGTTALRANRTGYPDETVKELLRDYDAQFKRPLKKLLTTWFRVTYNPELQFSGYLLEALGFRLCRYCYRKWA